MKKVLVASALFLSLLLPMMVLAQITITPAPTEFWDAFVNIFNVLFTGVLLIAIVFVFVGGYQFVTASGDPEQAGKARTTIMYAVIGIIVAVLARGLVGMLVDVFVP